MPSDASNSGSNLGLRRDAESRLSDATQLFVEPPEGRTQPVRTSQTSGGPRQTQQEEETRTTTVFPRSLAPKGSGRKGIVAGIPIAQIFPRGLAVQRRKKWGIAAGITIASHDAASLPPHTNGAFPEARLEKEKQESWVQKHIVKPVRQMVREMLV